MSVRLRASTRVLSLRMRVALDGSHKAARSYAHTEHRAHETKVTTLVVPLRRLLTYHSPVVGCTGHCVTLFLWVIWFGAVPDEQKYVIYARCSKEIALISYCFGTILNFVGFRKFLMTASRCHTSFLCVPQGHKSEPNFVKRSSWHMLSD